MSDNAFIIPSDFEPNLQQPAADIPNPAGVHLMGDLSTDEIDPLQLALDERAADADRIADEGRLVLTSHEVAGASAQTLEGVAPQYTKTLPDGRDVVISGDPMDDAGFCHEQGDNDLGVCGDCGLCSAQDVLNQFGVDVSENEVVHHAVDNGLCDVDPTHPENSGGTTADWERQVLADYGIPSHIENEGTLDDLARNVDIGSGVIAEVNAGVLWNDASSFEDGSANHAVTVTGVVRDEATGAIAGFYVNDSGDGQGAKYVDAGTMQSAWADAGGQSVITDVTR